MPTIEKRNDAYRITVSAGYDAQGKQIKKRMTWKPLPTMTEKQIQKELERQAVLFEEQVISGKVLDGNIKFEDFAEKWFTDYAEIHLRNLTLQRYRQLAKRTYQAIGNIKINRLQPHNLIDFYKSLGQESADIDCSRTLKIDLKPLLTVRDITYSQLAESAGLGIRTVKAAASGQSVSDKTADCICRALQVPKGELFKVTETEEHKLSPKTIKHYHAFISSIMERAVKWGIIDSNPCHKVDAPKVTKKEIECLTTDQARLL